MLSTPTSHCPEENRHPIAASYVLPIAAGVSQARALNGYGYRKQECFIALQFMDDG